MSSPEPSITSFLEMLADIERSFGLRAAELRRNRRELREAVASLQIGNTTLDERGPHPPGEPVAGLHIEVYLEATNHQDETARWWLLALRQEAGWKIERVLEVITVSESRLVREFPPMLLEDSSMLVHSLPRLAGELLAVSAELASTE
jgi:hypothetical protein